MIIASDHSKNLSIWQQLAGKIRIWGRELGFQQTGITDIGLGKHRDYLQNWLDNSYHGEMQWMQKHQREAPETLVPGAMRVISARMDYLPENPQQVKILKQSDKAYLSRYALGRDYHKVVRRRLAKLGRKIVDFCTTHGETGIIINQRPFVDSAPVMEKAFAEKAGLGWIGKHTLVLNQTAGSWFFLGELITNLPLPVDVPETGNHCGTCEACLKICPTDAFVAPWQLDARRCISYLTIELKGPIPEEFRESMGNRVFGCDDCQMICPWNKFAQPSSEPDFAPRHQLGDSTLLELFLWTEEEYLGKTEGSPIRRIGYERWLRNLAIGLGNAEPASAIINALEQRQSFPSQLVQEHIQWALARQHNPKRRQGKITNLAKHQHQNPRKKVPR